MRVTLLTLDPLEHDSRVLRMARAFKAGGHTITVVGLAPRPADSDDVDIVALRKAGPAMRTRAGMLFRQGPAQIAPWAAKSLYWLSLTRRQARDALFASRPDLVIAVDWKTLPIALAARDRLGCRVIYDSHELASSEFEDSSMAWRLLGRRHVQEIERCAIARVDGVVTVSDGLADQLQALYRLPHRPVVVRNIPDTQPAAFRPTGDRISVLYQGLIAPHRGLEATIASVRDWQTDRSLLIRGFGQPAYMAQLRALVAAQGVEERIAFEPAVPPDAIVRTARSSDIGIFALPGQSAQRRFALPNKMFEYMASGLALVVSDLPEMRRMVTAQACGTVIPEVSRSAIAAAINGLDRGTIDRHKQASLDAASGLSFRAEFAKMAGLVGG